MKRQVRTGVFETNSSSVHAITLCTEEDYKLWEDGKKIYSKWNDELVPITEEIMKMDDIDRRWDMGLYTKEEFDNYEYLHFETFEEEYKTKSGEKVIAFGYYGYDG